ncbi:MAG TPA: DUF1667 domain-containing protein [Bacillota bacterium]|nr:DUF1667 domain-containing protein [Clostridiales bacterium]HPT86186.1 DUF1667 domain-containing protein [Bacillota bacterium]
MSTVKKFTCIVCPVGCELVATLTDDGKTVISVEGNSCKRGVTYAVEELTAPKRTLTSTVRIVGADDKLLPVRTSRPIPKSAMFDAMKIIKTVTVKAPVKTGDVLVADFIEPGTSLIATKTVDAL